jgi:hypothetical protein
LRPLARRVDPEWLDELPADDPRAVRSRRDLRLMNRIMGHAAIIRRTLRSHLAHDIASIAELGAGDGTLLLRALPAGTRARIVFVDRQPVVGAATIARYRGIGVDASVAAADVFDWLGSSADTCACIVANLFLHHFEAAQLTELFALASQRAPLFVACEPRRARLPLAGSRMLGLIGCNDVTRHDAYVSVRAGFHDGELSRLWPKSAEWRLQERQAGLFSHVFIAARKP